MDSDCKANTDREIYRVTPGDYYADSIFVTEEGYIGINRGGSVVVLPLKTWHALASGTRPEESKLLAAAREYIDAYHANNPGRSACTCRQCVATKGLWQAVQDCSPQERQSTEKP